VGDHTVKYEATTTDGHTLLCSFQIHVKGKLVFIMSSILVLLMALLFVLLAATAASASAPAEINYPDLMLPVQETHSSLFAGHESYVVCPGKEPVKVTSKQSVSFTWFDRQLNSYYKVQSTAPNKLNPTYQDRF